MLVIMKHQCLRNKGRKTQQRNILNKKGNREYSKFSVTDQKEYREVHYNYLEKSNHCHH